MPKIKVKDGELSYEIHGSGEPLILLHCGFFDSRNWKNQIGSLSKHFKVIPYDQRGAGQSDVPVAAFSHVEDLRELMDGLGIEKASFLGHSLGAQIGIDFATVYPHRVKKMVMLAPGLSGYEWSKEYQAWVVDLLGDLRPEVMTKKIVDSGMCTVTLGGESKHRKDISDSVLHNTSKLLTWKSSDVKWPSPFGMQALDKITAPTLLIVGDQDIPDIQNVVKVLNKGIAKSEVKTFKGCDHMINFYKPEEFNDAAVKFLK